MERPSWATPRGCAEDRRSARERGRTYERWFETLSTDELPTHTWIRCRPPSSRIRRIAPPSAKPGACRLLCGGASEVFAGGMRRHAQPFAVAPRPIVRVPADPID